jgi:peptidylprolyl isomerase
MTAAKEGARVRVHYTGKLPDGRVFDSSHGRDPVEFTVGEGEVLPGIERMVQGMHVGESRTETLPPEEAFGKRRKGLIFQVPRDDLPVTIQPYKGQRLLITSQDGVEAPVKVREVNDAVVTLDANHPLAGRTVVFEVQLLDVVA